MHDLHLLVWISLVNLQYLVADVFFSELVYCGTRKHTELSVHRIDAALLIFRQVALGDVARGETERRIHVRLDKHDARAE